MTVTSDADDVPPTTATHESATAGDGDAAERQPLGRMSGFREAVGYEVRVWREGYAEISLDLEPRHMNRMGIVHGGVYMTILDAAMGHAATHSPDPAHRRRCVTMAMNTSFLASARAGRITAIGTLVGTDARNATCRGEIRDDAGTVLIVAQASFRYASGSA